MLGINFNGVVSELRNNHMYIEKMEPDLLVTGQRIQPFYFWIIFPFYTMGMLGVWCNIYVSCLQIIRRHLLCKISCHFIIWVVWSKNAKFNAISYVNKDELRPKAHVNDYWCQSPSRRTRAVSQIIQYLTSSGVWSLPIFSQN